MADEQMKDPAGSPPSRWRTMILLVGFSLLTALVLLIAKGPPVDRETMTRVSFGLADLAQVSATFERTWSRPPTATELQNAFDQYVRSEVLYREALARELDRNDPVVRMSLVRKITMLGTAQAEAAEPTDEELAAYFELRTERYRIPAFFTLFQVYLSRDVRGDGIAEDVARLLTALTDQDPEPADLADFGDSSMLPTVVENASEEELARTFGQVFRDSVLSLPVGQWQGPVESGFGLHLVKIVHRQESRIPDWTEVRDRIATDLAYEARTAAEDQFYAEVLPRYQIVYDEGVVAALEGEVGRDSAPAER